VLVIVHDATPTDRHDASGMTRCLVELEQPYDANKDIGVYSEEFVRFALEVSDYWADPALGWLADGLPVAPVAEVLRDFAADKTHPQSQRHRATRLLKGH
jgi:hypothetical protein